MKKFAVLIDADNTTPTAIEPVLEEIAKYGIASVKRIYGDWSIANLQSWRDKLLPNAITPVQQFAYVKQKDATDMKLVIDAMDLLYAGDLNGFCIVSSDSDFTPLASRIRESGLTVYGFGKNNTVNSFINACDRFFYIENLLPELKPNFAKTYSSNSFSQSLLNETKVIEQDATTLNLIYKAVKECTKDNGWAEFGHIGNYISTVKPDFDTRSYGYGKLSELISSLVVFDTKTLDKTIYIKKFSFTKLVNHIQNILTEQTPENDWVSVKSVAHFLYQKRQINDLENYSQADILQKIDAINVSLLEFNTNRTKIRLSTQDSKPE